MIALNKTQFINYPTSRATENYGRYQAALAGLAKIAGGFSVVDLNGGWVMADGSLCMESIKRIEVATGDEVSFRKVQLHMTAIACQLVEMGEEAVMMGTVGGVSELWFADDLTLTEAKLVAANDNQPKAIAA